MRALVGRTAWPTWLGLGSSVLFLALGLLVVAGATHPLDLAATARLRPGDAWGPAQVAASPWMSRLAPEHMFPLLAVAAVAACARRRSWRPALFALALAGTSVALTVATKLALQRTDPHGYLAPSGGSYPSGHVVGVLVCCAGSLMVLSPRVRWWQWAPVLVASALMARALLVSAAHWPSDVAGGALLALAVLGLLSRLPLRRPRAQAGSATGVTSSAAAVTSPGATASAPLRNDSRRGATTSAS